MHLPSGTVRQYSLCGDPAQRDRYRIAVLELPDGRGGSMEAHRELRPGRIIDIGVPRSNFALTDADRYVFVAGGIGITPILPMIREVATRGIKWELVYGAKSDAHFAFTGERPPTALRVVAQDTDGPDRFGRRGRRRRRWRLVYCCGPAPLMDSLIERMEASRTAVTTCTSNASAPHPPPEFGQPTTAQL